MSTQQIKVKHEGVEGEVTYQDKLGYSDSTGLFSRIIAQVVCNSHKYQVKEQLKSGWDSFFPFSVSVRDTYFVNNQAGCAGGWKDVVRTIYPYESTA
jgi:hypothetical protein